MSILHILLKENVRVFNPDKLFKNNDTEPIKNNDTIRVFHGFRDFNDAYEACKFGLSGTDRAKRVYSYESVNNPQGLFVTIDFKIAKEFAGAYPPSVIIEFSTKASDLEAPVWKSGNYTVQGGYSGQFSDLNDRQTSKELKLEEILNQSHVPNFVKESDDPLMAYYLLFSREYQSLFKGNLNPNMIKYVWVSMGDRIDKEFKRIKVAEFLKNFKIYYTRERSGKENLVLQPNDKFSIELFVKRAREKYEGNSDEFLKNYITGLIEDKDYNTLLIHMNMGQVEQALGKKYDPFKMEFI